MRASEEDTAKWTFDAYYVNEQSLYDTRKTENFTLKYQMEFHTSQDLEEGAVEIRIPGLLFNYRDGTEIFPTDIAVPGGTPEQINPGKNTPFNYYMDGSDLVFFNYKAIVSGSNAAFQIMYKNLEVMKIVDMTTWSLKPQIRVKTGDKVEEREPRALTGTVDTYAKLNTVSKNAYVGGQSYTPGLYTKKQVSSFISGGLPEEYEQNFESYRFAVWEVKASGGGTQPFELVVKETPSIEGNASGKLVGVKGKKGFLVEETDIGSQTAKIQISGNPGSWSGSLYVVTAYPAEEISAGTVLENEVEVELTPYDRKDPAISKKDHASWIFEEYEWKYPGDIIRIQKEQDQTYESWLEIYRFAKVNREDKGDFSFVTESTCRGYGMTHITSGTDIGTYEEGASYTTATADDKVVAYISSSEDARELTGEDYYFKEVQITQKDYGYDVWENDFSAPENADGVSQTLSIYAVFADVHPADQSEDAWEYVADVKWDDSGEMSYRFTEEQIERKPWKVKAVHTSINYQTSCKISVKLRLRYNSPVMEELLLEDPDQITVKNISRIEAEMIDENQEQEEEKSPVQMTMEDDAFARLTGLLVNAASYKTAKTTNDAVNGRAVVEYCLTAHDGYLVENEEDAAYLRSNNVPSPSRKSVVFYDLLPLGMRFDPSEKVTAGRLKNLGYSGIYNTPNSWDTSQVEVKVDSEKDIIENYKGTGRTMVIFHVTYLGADASVVTRRDSRYTDWMEGWGVSFQAYYDWKDEQVSQAEANISAFMPEAEDDTPLLGNEDEVACDDGVIVPDTFAEDYRCLGSDINQDRITDIRNVLYARTLAPEDIALASQSDIQKLVRADEDRFGVYRKSASVSPTGGYTYDITVTNTSAQPMGSIVIYDRLEHAATDRRGVQGELEFESNWWYGTYQSLILDGLNGQEIAPVVYFNESRDAVISEGTQSPDEVLTRENGWIRVEIWEEMGKQVQDVKAIAVDISRKTDGEDFVLGHLESATFQIKMTAPETVEEGMNFAYNNPAFYSVTNMNGEDTAQTVNGNSVKVSLGGDDILEIEKCFLGEVPDAAKNQEFEFTLQKIDEQEIRKFANQEYQLWKKNAGDEWEQEEGLFATDADGRMSLKAGEKAIFFRVKDVGNIQISEEENPFWEETQTETSAELEGGMKRMVRVANAYRPVLYVQKELSGVPEEIMTDEETFTFQILANGEPLSDAEFWYVDSVRMDGGIPQKVLTLGLNGVGKTDEKGRFSIRKQEIIALFPGKNGTKYTLKEMKDDDWICKTDTVEGTLESQGTSEIITNFYRWKELYLTKQITHQNAEECVQEFKFRITDEKGNPIRGNRWVLLENDVETKTSGALDADGIFSCACGGRTVKIEKLEAGETYIIEEIESGDLYEKVNQGLEKVTMPLYSSKKAVILTNDYVKRSFSISKTVLYDITDTAKTEELKEKQFTMTVTVGGEILKNYPYSILENGEDTGEVGQTDDEGQFFLKDNQTAYFSEAGNRGDIVTVTETQDTSYPQIYPLAKAPAKEILQEDANISIINGNGGLLIGKSLVGMDEDAREYIEILKNDSAKRKKHSVRLALYVTDRTGDTTQWPKAMTTVYAINQDGTVENKTWLPEGGNLDGRIEVEPWSMIYIAEKKLTGAISYSVCEREEDRHQIREWEEGKYISISQETPQGDLPAQGIIKENPVAMIVNKIECVNPVGSTIEKRMQIGSKDVPEGARLSWRVERYDGTGWRPAKGVSYLTFDGGGLTSDRVLQTTEDGKILLTKTANEFPFVRFLDEEVRLNLYQESEEGDLRIVEIMEESDEDWGYLVGYGTAENFVEYSLDQKPEDAMAFVNANCGVPIEIEKQMEEKSETVFTMFLRQVVSASCDSIKKTDDIVADQAARGIPYQIYDGGTGKQIGDGITGALGDFILKAGQYARFELPGDTVWTVSEQEKSSYTLQDLYGSSVTKTKRLAANLMLVSQTVPEDQIEDIAITRNMMTVVDAATRKTVSMTQGDVVIPEMILLDNKVYRVTGIADETFNNRLITGITFPKTLRTIGAKAFYQCSSLTKELVLPEGLTTIGDFAFGACKVMEGELVIPDTVVSIGNSAFWECRSLSGELKIPKSVKFIGNRAFSVCMKLTGTLVLPGSEATLGEEVFSNCHGITEVIVPEDVTRIENYTFYACNSLKKIKIPDSVTYIGNYAFCLCESLEDLEIGNSVETIGSNAFKWCESLTGQLRFPASVTTMTGSIFYGCKGLDSIYIDKPKGSVEGSPWGFPKGEKGILWKEETTS